MYLYIVILLSEFLPTCTVGAVYIVLCIMIQIIGLNDCMIHCKKVRVLFISPCRPHLHIDYFPVTIVVLLYVSMQINVRAGVLVVICACFTYTQSTCFVRTLDERTHFSAVICH